MKAPAVWKRLLPYFHEHRYSVLKALLAAITLTAGSLARPMILRYMIDSVVPASDVQSLVLFSLLFVVILGITVIVGYRQLILMSKVGLSIVNKIKAQLFEHILSLDLSFYNKNKVGWILSRVESDTEQLKQLCSHIAARVFTDFLLFLGIILSLLISDYEIALPMVGIILFLLVLVLCFLNWIKAAFDHMRSCLADVTGFISEYVQGIQIIQLYNRERDIQRELKAKSDLLYLAQVQANCYSYGFWAFFALMTETCLIAIILYIGLGKYQEGTMSIGKLVMFVEFARQMTWPLHCLSENLNQIQRAFVAAERIFKLFDTKTLVPDTVEDAGESWSPEVIEFKDVSFAYAEDLEPALRNISFTIQKGEKIAIVGPSGGGKTTTANMICRFYDPTSGSVMADGVDLRDISLKAWRRSIGLVLQDVCLFPGTVLDNLRALNRDIPREKVEEAARKLGAHQFIQRFSQGYDTELSERGNNLSQGERQLLSFTRALVSDPTIMILDEATSSIDRHTEKLIQTALDKLLEGRTAIIIAHRLSTIENVDRILVFSDGKIVEDGSHKELLKLNGLYRRLYSLQTSSEQGGENG